MCVNKYSHSKLMWDGIRYMKVMKMTTIMCSTRANERKTVNCKKEKKHFFFFWKTLCHFCMLFSSLGAKDWMWTEISNDLLYYSIFRRYAMCCCTMFFLYSFCHVKLLFITVLHCCCCDDAVNIMIATHN